MQSKVINMTGQRIGRLEVLGRGQNRGKRAYWVCRCDCGRLHTVMGRSLRTGETRSCGCLQTEQRAKGNPKPGHGGATGGKLTREYQKWRDMKERCYNPKNSKYRYYGGRGVAVCDRWLADFPAFKSDMGPCPAGYSLDRIDCDGNYEPSNCRWTPLSEQLRNTRRTVWVQIGDQKQCAAAALRQLCVPRNKHASVYRHMRHGATFREAIARATHVSSSSRTL